MINLQTRSQSTRSGFSIAEIVVSAGILAIAATAMISFLIFSHRGDVVFGDRAQAVLLAEEGLEAVRSIRDEDYALVADGTHGLQQSTSWVTSGSNDTVGKFTRTVSISSVGADRKLVQSDISWNTFYGATSLILGTYLTNWGRLETGNTFRITEYYIPTATFTGTSYNLTLDQDLASNYFVIIQGADGSGSGGGNTGPDENYVALTADPFSSGDLASSGASDEISLTRQGNVDGWSGVITVVECLSDCSNSGFQLLTVERTNHIGSVEVGTDTSGVDWNDISQVMLMGGVNGAGCDTVENATDGHKACQARIWPSATNTINWQRDITGGEIDTAISTVMVLEWGSEWNVQRVTVSGSNGGNGADNTSEYDTTAISTVQRQDTWVWGTGWTDDGGIGDAAEGTLITLGNGVNTSTPVSTVAVGQEYSDTREFEVYTLSHPRAYVEYLFKQDGNSIDLTYDATTELASGSSARMGISYNGQGGTDNSYPRSLFSTRFTGENTIRMERRRSGQNFPAWIQGIDLSYITPGGGSTDTTVPATTTDLTATSPTETTIDLTWTAPGDDGNLGIATTYDVRYSTANITLANWGSATQATTEPAPSIPGTSETMTVGGLTANTLYYFAIRTTDELGNLSGLSNIETTSTLSNVVINTCAQYCQSLGGYSGGTCRANANQCNNNSETHETAGDVLCTGGGGSDTCCCAP